mmetsp:Transcript_90927/g.294252  ORF Transcript_90927/g.294252 Transcript_90927/m.294252 type:complete len:191 (-) Transcript_90927:7-579(-)
MAEEAAVPMNEVFQGVLDSFRDPKFVAEVEVFVNTNIQLFAQPTLDGSHPLDWTFQHKKYKKLYEDQLLKALNGADITEFMNYLQQCQDAYGNDANFQNLLSSLTASEDYASFLQVMFAAVRENWVPDEAAPPPPAPSIQVHPVDVAVPEGYAPGMAMSIEYLGRVHQVIVPEGYGPGMVLRAELQVPVE